MGHNSDVYKNVYKQIVLYLHRRKHCALLFSNHLRCPAQSCSWKCPPMAGSRSRRNCGQHQTSIQSDTFKTPSDFLPSSSLSVLVGYWLWSHYPAVLFRTNTTLRLDFNMVLRKTSLNSQTSTVQSFISATYCLLLPSDLSSLVGNTLF